MTLAMVNQNHDMEMHSCGRNQGISPLKAGTAMRSCNNSGRAPSPVRFGQLAHLHSSSCQLNPSIMTSVNSVQTTQQAADQIWSLWQARGHLDHLPPALRPATRAQAYAIQACYERRSAQPLFGWKIAATSNAGQQHIAVDGPLAGRILAERVIANDGTIELAGNQMRVVEGEFAFRMGRDLPPRATPYDRAEVIAAIATLHPAIEVPDSRFHPFEAAGAAQLIADNACTDFFILGAAAPDAWRSLDLVAHRVTARIKGGAEFTGSGINVLGDPLLALTWIANELSGIGVTLKKDQVVTTGTCFKPFAVVPGDAVEVDFGVVGRVGVRFAN